MSAFEFADEWCYIRAWFNISSIYSIDEPLYNHYERNMTALLGMAEEHVAFANKIFGEQGLNSIDI